MTETRCNQPAFRKYFWPGRDPAHVCDRHFSGLTMIAESLGLYLPFQPPDPGATCDQIIKERKNENQTT